MKTIERVVPPVVVEPARPAGSGLQVSTFRSFAHRDFRLLWFSVAFSSAGQWFEQVALNWLVYEITGDPLTLALVNGLKAVPALLAAPLSGVAADRMERKRLMLLSQIAVMALALWLSMLIFLDWLEVWHLYVFAGLTGLAWSFNMPVRQSLVPNLVPREDLTNAIALQSSAFQLTRLIGPALAGFVILWFGPGGAFLTKGLVYIGVIAMILRMNVPALLNDQAESLWATLRGGFTYILRERQILSLILLALIPQMFAMPYFTLLPVFAKDVLGAGPEGYGILVTLPGVGAMICTLTIASLGDVQRKGKVMLIAGVAFGVGILLLAATSKLADAPVFFGLRGGYLATGFMLAFIGACMMTFNTLTNTLLQTITTDAMRGRVMSLYMLDQGLTPLGTTWAGFLASLPFLGAPGAYAVMGITVVLLTSGVTLRFPHLRKL